MSIRKLFFGFSILFSLLTAATAVVLIVVSSRLSDMAANVGGTAQSVRASEELQVELLNHNLVLRADISSGKSTWDAKLRDRENEIETWLAATERNASDEAERSLIAALRRDIHTYFREAHEMEADKFYPTGSIPATLAIFEKALNLAESLTDINARKALEIERRVRAENRIANIIGIAFSLLCVITLGFVWVAIRYWIYRPIQTLRELITSYSGARKSAALRFSGPTELKSIARSFEDLSDRLADQRESQLQFLASVAHDLRNPLGAIRSSAELMMDDDDNGSMEDKRPLIDIIGRQTHLLDRMVGDLLDASRIEAGQLELNRSPQELNRLVEDAVILHRSLSPLHTIAIESHADPITLDCDPLRISQVINNLLNNAIKYSPNGGRINVILSAEPEDVVLQVKDEGIGIAESDLSSIFEPFRRAQLGQISIPGVGLGLSVTKRIVEAHGGSISVKSEVAKGSVFSVHLPRRRMSQRNAESSESFRSRSRSGSIP